MGINQAIITEQVRKDKVIVRLTLVEAFSQPATTAVTIIPADLADVRHLRHHACPKLEDFGEWLGLYTYLVALAGS